MFELRNVTLPLLFVAGALAACSAAPSADSTGSTGQSSSSEALKGAGLRMCPVASTYIVLTPTEPGEVPACPDVSGAGGTWQVTPQYRPRPCTSNVDPSGTSVLCSYQWASATGDAPDLAALQALAGVTLSAGGDGGSDECNADATLRFASLLNLAGVTCPRLPGPGPNAPRECDVCGRNTPPGVVHDQLVLAPSTPLHTLAVTLTNGSQQIVTIVATGDGSSGSSRTLVDVSLPPPPPGVSYVRGPALAYGYRTASP